MAGLFSGQKFANLEMKSILAKIIMNYELLPTEHTQKVTVDLTLRPLDGVFVKLQQRKKGQSH
jgi:hypothetical protein